MRWTIVLALVMVGAWGGAAHATTGWGCYRVNVSPNDPLNVRAGASARSAVVATVSWADQPIIALEGVPRRGGQPSLFDVHRTEGERCVPQTLPLGARWCPVTLVDADGSVSGWVKRRFVDHSECP